MSEPEIRDPEGNALDVGDFVSCPIKDEDGDWVEAQEAEIVGVTKKRGFLQLRIACLACGFKRRVTRAPSAVHLTRRTM